MLSSSPTPHALNLQFFQSTPLWFEIPGGISGVTLSCGYMFALVEYPRQDEEIESADDACAFLEERAKAVFSSPGNALADICSRPKADCSNGVGVLGITQGAMVATVGAGLPDLPYPIAAVASSQTGVESDRLGVTTRLECLTSSAVAESLPNNKRRSAISSTDGRFGATPAEVIEDQKEFSGYDCGDSFDCLQDDGSGYVVFDTSTINKTIPHGGWGVWSVRGQSSYTVSEHLKWLLSAISPEPPAAACQPGCVPQYDLPMAARRRLLFSSMPAEAEMCPATDMPDFGTFLVTAWLAQAEQLSAAVLAGLMG
jgi:hypothetical protein